MAVTDLPIVLAPGTTALAVPGRLLAPRPRLWLNSPAVVLRPDTAESASGEEHTVGSSAWLWEDDEEWRFDAHTGVLTSAVFNLPEVNTRADLDLRAWAQAPAIAGTVQLKQPADFRRPPASVRWFASDGTELAAFYHREPSTGQPRRRIAIADRTDLLIAGTALVGWSITDPARFITGASVPASEQGTETDPCLPPLLATFFSLATEENIDKLENGDSALRNGLEELATRLEAVGYSGESRATEILIKVQQILEDFSA